MNASDSRETFRISFADPNTQAFPVRWRGREQPALTGEAIERKLAANEMGLLHEIQHGGQWVTIREYLGQRAAELRARRETEEEQKRKERERQQKEAQEREHQKVDLMAVQERRKDELLQTLLQRQIGAEIKPLPIKPHRGGILMLMGIVGLAIPFLGFVVWIVASKDLAEMNVRRRDSGGRFFTEGARLVGVLGTALWLVLVIFLLFARFGGISSK
jgi:hypothetical protein